MSSVKSTIKKLMVAKENKKYNSILKYKNMDYNSWISQLESQKFDNFSAKIEKVKCLTNDLSEVLFDGDIYKNDSRLAESNELCKLIDVLNVSNEHEYCKNIVLCKAENANKVIKLIRNNTITADAIILTEFDGILAKFSIEKISVEFSDNKNLIMIYGDEDTINDENYRYNPWFKPDWSPDTFLEYLYIGSLVALNTTAVKELEFTDSDTVYSYLYKMLLLNKAFDIRSNNNENVTIKHIPEILYHTFENVYDRIINEQLDMKLKERVDDVLVSVIIPSKDHPDILFRCIDSFIDKTRNDNNVKYEFIVVDNGSDDNNKNIINDLLLKYGATYIYERKEFNFSYMCNIGAKAAKGQLLLFLNDDMEIIQKNWLELLVEKASLPYAGAVGAKLLYPNSDIIQHAGITNLRIGPAHKLQFLSDSIDHYFGKNRYVHNMLAVTGACLMVKKSIFDEIGGFDENLAVAFNDVDLCYRIYEKGYYNIERCDVTLFHHESLSRGNDSKSEAKQLRLNKEKDYLYEHHQSLYGIDPFYNINLTTDMWEYEYAPKYHYEVKLNKNWDDVKEITDVIEKAHEDNCVRVGMECAMDIFKWKYGVPKEKSSILATDEDLGFYFQGYTFVIGSDNACFERMLFLKNTATNKYYGINTSYEYRPDIAGNVPDQLNVDLAGYVAKIKADILPEGHYQFGMYMKDKTSSLRLYNMSNWTLDI